MTGTFNRRRFSRAGKTANTSRGLVLYYYGDGKGKTTAAVGIAVRARGAGMRVAFLQFMKTERWPSFERAALKKLGVTVEVLGSGFVGIIDDRHPLAWHKRQARLALALTKRLLRSKAYGVVVADELVSAVDEKLLTVKDVLGLLAIRPKTTHLVMTGHNRYPAIVKASDLVTGMRNIKHPYYTDGLLAQKGIDF